MFTKNHNGTKYSFLARGQLQVTLGNGNNVADTENLKHYSGYDRARNDDQRVVEHTKLCNRYWISTNFIPN